LNILARYQKKNNLTLTQMAKKGKVTPSTLYKHIHNQRSISPAIILKYMKAYDIPAQALLKIRVK